MVACHSTNLLERFHGEIKKGNGNKEQKLQEVIMLLVRMTNRLLKKRGRSVKDEKRKFSTNKEHPFIEKMSKVYTPCAVKYISLEFYSEKNHFSCSAVNRCVNF